MFLFISFRVRSEVRDGRRAAGRGGEQGSIERQGERCGGWVWREWGRRRWWRDREREPLLHPQHFLRLRVIHVRFLRGRSPGHGAIKKIYTFKIIVVVIVVVIVVLKAFRVDAPLEI